MSMYLVIKLLVKFAEFNLTCLLLNICESGPEHPWHGRHAWCGCKFIIINCVIQRQHFSINLLFIKLLLCRYCFTCETQTENSEEMQTCTFKSLNLNKIFKDFKKLKKCIMNHFNHLRYKNAKQKHFRHFSKWFQTALHIFECIKNKIIPNVKTLL